jgi:adenine-specific DNA methylase
LLGTKGEGHGIHLVDCRDEYDPQLLRKFQAPQEPVQNSTEKWTQYFLDDEQRTVLRAALSNPRITLLGSLASVDVGVVTGENAFFIIDSERADELRIESRFLKPVVARTSCIKGTIFTGSEWKGANSKHLLVIDPSKTTSKSVRKYILSGENNGVHANYKCRIRDPWYTVPTLWVPHAFMFRQIGAFPRFVLNQSSATCTDTIHRLRFKNKALSREIISSFYNSLTFACAEMFGRSYGGGVLELMPTEAERLPLPLVGDAKLLVEMDRLVRKNPLDAVELGDERILHDGMKMSRRTISIIRSAWLQLSERRKTRRVSLRRPAPLGRFP